MIVNFYHGVLENCSLGNSVAWQDLQHSTHLKTSTATNEPELSFGTNILSEWEVKGSQRM